MFVPGITAHRLRGGESTSWNYEDMCYDVDYISVGSEEDSIYAITMSPDGTHMFICGRNTAIFRSYTLSTPWKLSTATYDAKTFTAASISQIRQIIFALDGEKLIYAQDDFIYQHTLSIAWDLDTVGSATTYNPAEGSDAKPIVYISPDGTRMYWEERTYDTIWQYTLSTPWDITTATYDNKSWDHAAVSTLINTIQWSHDGTKFFVGYSDLVHTYNASTAWDITTLILDSTYTFGENKYGDGGTGIVRQQWGGYNSNEFLFLGNSDQNVVFRYKINCVCPTIADLIYDTDFIDVGSEDVLPIAVAFNLSGTKMFMGGGDAEIYQYTLSTAWDVSSATYDSVFLAVEDAVDSIVFNSDGTKITYACDDENVYQRTLSTGYDLSTAGSSTFFDSLDVGADMGGHDISPDGTKLYIVSRTTDTVYQYTLETPWDVTTAVGAGGGGGDAWAFSGYAARVKVTVDNSGQTTNDLDNFPLLVRLNGTDFPGLDLTATVGADVRFADSSANALKYEVENWDDSGNTSDVWVKVPTIAASSTTEYIYVYYDNPSATYDQSAADEEAVWDTNYVGVWHMDGLLDSTGNSNDGTNTGTTDTTGQIGQGREFGGTDQLDMGSASSLDNLPALTFSTWLNQTETAISASRLFEKRATSAESKNLYIASDNKVEYIQKTSAESVDRSSVAISNNTWYHIAVTWDGTLNETGIEIYIDGVAAPDGGGDGTGTIVDDSGGNLWIGSRNDGLRTLRGMMDEVRMSKVVRSADWIAASFLNQKDSSTYTDVGDVETDSKRLDVSTETASPGGISWCASGERFFITNSNIDILQYSASVPWDISTGTYDRLYNPATDPDGDGNSGERRQIYIYQDGNDARMFFANQSTDDIYAYTAFQWGLLTDY